MTLKNTISTLFIESFRNFNDFKMIFPPKYNKGGENLNLNIIIGRNGAGKSNLLDALYNIGINNNLANVGFNFYALNEKNETVLDNYKEKQKNSNEGNNYFKRVVRFHCSDISRNKEKDYSNYNNSQMTSLNQKENTINPDFSLKHEIYFSDKYLDFNIERSPFALIAYVLSGKYDNKDSLWKQLNKIVIEENIYDQTEKTLQVHAIWIKSHGENIDFSNNNFLPQCSYKIRNEQTTYENDYTYFWILDDITPVTGDPITILINYLDTNDCYDMGFMYKTEKDGDIYSSISLSDGQRALIYRYAIINLLKNEKEKCLLLLDEPETFFNEYWKSYFVYLIWETLKERHHDIFIATHSAMLITDTKPEEVHRIVDTPNGAYHYKPQVNTYGVSVVDIGKYLFMMESDIGNRSKNEILQVLNLDIKKTNNKELQNLENDINKLLRQVGPGEWRWKLRIKQKEIINELQKQEKN